MGDMSHGSVSANPAGPKGWREMTIGEAIGKLKGGPPALGMPGITLGQILKAFTSYGTPDFATAMKDIITAPQDPNGWTMHRSFKAKDLCQNCSVLSVKADLVYENGTRVDISRGVYLHHHASLNLGRHTDIYWLNQCPNNQTTRFGINFQDFIPRVIPSIHILALATVDEYTNYFTSKDGKIDSGLPVNADDNIYMMTEAVNYAKHDHKIFIQLDVEYLEKRLPKDTTYTSLSFTGGCDPVWGFTGNGTVGNITSQPFNINYPGRVVNARGHLHDGGTSLDILLNNKVVCSSRAVYGTELKINGKDWTTLSQMTDCTDPFTVKKGDQIRLVVNYDEISHPKRQSHGSDQEEMGFMYFTFIPT